MLVRLFIANLMMGFISFPVAQSFFKGISDKGYAVGHLFGWFCVSFISFFLSHLKIPVYYSVYLALGIWLAINLWAGRKNKNASAWSNLSIADVVISQGIFLIFATFLYLARIGSFTLSTVERTPDFAIIKSLFNTDTLPPDDVWLTGKAINYYYFGHYIAFTIMSLAGLEPIAGFFYLVVWMFGLYALCIFRFGENLYRNIYNSLSLPVSRVFRRFSFESFLSYLAGFLSIFLVFFAGNLYSAKYILSADFSFWTPTRFVPGTIMEIPLFSFFVADLHAHMWGMAIGILVLFTLLAFWFDSDQRPLFNNFFVYLMSFLLGLAVVTNTWDVLSLGVLVGVMVLAKYIKNLNSSSDFLAVLLNLAILVTVPLVWLVYYKQEGDSGIGFTGGGSGLWNLFLHWGGFLLPFVILVLFYPKKLLSKLSFIWLFCGVSVLLIIFTEFFFIKDIMASGEFRRANTVFKVYMQIWLWSGAIVGPIVALLIKPPNKLKNSFEGKIITLRFFTISVILALTVYPYLTLKQNIVPRFDRPVYEGMAFFYDYLPVDYRAYLYLKDIQDTLPRSQKQKIIVEAPGESFQNQSLFSSYLGWPTILGWVGHVWTYRGTYTYVQERLKELEEIYTGASFVETKKILEKYNVDYIVVGTLEKKKYPNLNLQKLVSLGSKVFDEGSVFVIQVNKDFLVAPYQSTQKANDH